LRADESTPNCVEGAVALDLAHSPVFARVVGVGDLGKFLRRCRGDPRYPSCRHAPILALMRSDLMLCNKSSTNCVRAASIFLLTMMSISHSHAGGLLTVLTVGNTANCDFNTLQSAINAASTQASDTTIIRVVKADDNVSLQITDRNITLDGRWRNCSSLAPEPDIREIIAGNGLDSVIRVTTTGLSSRTLILRGLQIHGGGADDALNERGGGLRINGRVEAQLYGVSISSNVSILGGGIAVEGAFASLLLDEGSIIGNDGAFNANGADGIGPALGLGGGIYCADGQVTIHNAVVRSNTSSDHGGGLYLDHCLLFMHPLTDVVGNGSFFPVTGNVAFNGNGGGLYATGGSTISWRSEPAGAPAGTAFNNKASARGGAIFLTGSSDFVGDWMRIQASSADGRGGAVAVQDNATLILRGGPNFSCSGNKCPGIFDTRGITQGEGATLIGGAIYAESGGQVDLRQQQIINNYASNGSAMHLSGSTTSAQLHSVLITRNLLYGVGNGTSTIELSSSADAVLRFVTMAGNFRVSDQFPGLARALSSIRANGNQSTVELRNSLFWNDADVSLRFLVGATASGSCVFGHEAGSFPSMILLDPQYVDTTGDVPDLRLAVTSPAIDRCATTGTNQPDIYGRIRPQDLLSVVNGLGSFDAGAIERADDNLLRDGFE
jgi:hypothetical protein